MINSSDLKYGRVQILFRFPLVGLGILLGRGRLGRVGVRGGMSPFSQT